MWHYLCLIDHSTRFLVAVPTKSTSSPPVIQAFNQFWLPYFQAPDAILADRGPGLSSTVVRQFITCELGAHFMLSSPYYPQGNGLNEAVHRVIEASLVARGQYDNVMFETALRDSVMAYNATPHSATLKSPNYMLFGTELNLPG